MNPLNQQLQAIQNSRQYLKKQLEQTKDPHIQEKLKHYIYGLNKDEERILQVLNKGDNKK